MNEQERKELRRKTSGAIDLLVAEGRAERVVIDGKPGVRLIRKLTDEPTAKFPDGFKAPLDERGTLELMHDRDSRAAERERCAKAVSPAAVFEVLKRHFTAHDRLPNIAREISALIQED